MSERGLAFVAQREACVLTKYQDTSSPAIGFGENDPSLKDGDTITFEEAVARYLRAVPGYEAGISSVFKDVPLVQQHFDAIFSAIWNVGETRLRQETRLVAAVKKFCSNPGDKILRDWAAYELLHLKWDVEHRPFNLTRRCLEVVVFTKEIYGDLTTLPLWREGRKPGVNLPENVPMPNFGRAA